MESIWQILKPRIRFHQVDGVHRAAPFLRLRAHAGANGPGGHYAMAGHRLAAPASQLLGGDTSVKSNFPFWVMNSKQSWSVVAALTWFTPAGMRR